MEVMLERVQFKFASIIGELCSEPLVLSQFAVWVDMRLAEYKLKGAISLDCSGETPDPIWMKGITFALTEKLKEAQSKAVKAQAGFRETKPQPRTGIGQSDSHISSYQDGPSLSEITHDLSDNVIVKAEPVDEQDIYPLSLYANSDPLQNSPLIKDTRKRPTSTAPSPYTSASEPLAKSSRLSMDDCEITDVTGEVDNTSLLSIIGMNTSQQDNQASTSQNIDTVTLEGDDSIQEYLSSPRQMGDNSSMISSQGSSNHDTNVVTNPEAVASSSVERGRVYNQTDPTPQDARLKSLDKRQRSHVISFDRWLFHHGLPGDVNFEDLSAAQLDDYLAQFFRDTRPKSYTIKDFTRNSFVNIRNSIAKFLRTVPYPHNIIKSPLFVSSQTAFKTRLLAVCRTEPRVVRWAQIPDALVLSELRGAKK